MWNRSRYGFRTTDPRSDTPLCEIFCFLLSFTHLQCFPKCENEQSWFFERIKMHLQKRGRGEIGAGEKTSMKINLHASPHGVTHTYFWVRDTSLGKSFIPNSGKLAHLRMLYFLSQSPFHLISPAMKFKTQKRYRTCHTSHSRILPVKPKAQMKCFYGSLFFVCGLFLNSAVIQINFQSCIEGGLRIGALIIAQETSTRNIYF